MYFCVFQTSKMTGMIEYIRFLLKSTNEHGVHSPFLFSLITKGLYSRNPLWNDKKKKDVFVERILNYFQPKLIMSSSSKGKNYRFLSIIDYMPWDSENFEEADILLIDETSIVDEESVIPCLSKMKNNAFVLIDKRERLKSTKMLWEKIVENDAVTVSVDFYFFGLAFVRKEQLKQHFRVRL